jgi:hypothetical protein
MHMNHSRKFIFIIISISMTSVMPKQAETSPAGIYEQNWWKVTDLRDVIRKWIMD